MKRRLPVRSRLVAAASCAGLFASSAGPLFAQAPLPAPLPALPAPNEPAVVAADGPTLELYYGTNKVVPKVPRPVEPAGAVEVITAPAPAPAPVAIPAAAARSSPGDAARTTDAFIQTLRDFRTGTSRVSEATVGLLNKVAERTQPAEPRPIILTNYATPASLPAMSNVNAPWLNAPAQNLPGAAPVIIHAPTISTAAPTSSSPNVVVVREPASEAKPMAAAPVAPPGGITLAKETLIACVVAIGSAFLALLSWSRSGRRDVVRSESQPLIAPAIAEEPNGIRLQGQFNAGEIPQTAEKFEIGASYHDEVRQKRVTEEKNNAAAVEFILAQNLELLAQLNPEIDPSVDPVVDHGGYALPAESHAPSDEEFTLAVRPVAG